MGSLDRWIHEEIVVDADIKSVWDAWTTEDGIRSFFAPACNLELRVNGAYEILFLLENEASSQGAEGMKIMAIQPHKMFAFTWNAPPHLSKVRGQLTHVVVRFEKLASGQTRVSLTHDGWGEGGEWDQAFDYFSKAWGHVVLPRLQYRFAVGPVDWDDPPRLDEQ